MKGSEDAIGGPPKAGAVSAGLMAHRGPGRRKEMEVHAHPSRSANQRRKGGGRRVDGAAAVREAAVTPGMGQCRLEWRRQHCAGRRGLNDRPFGAGPYQGSQTAFRPLMKRLVALRQG